MSLAVFAGPVIGAAIGYCTNYIAVKMMFRPLNPVKVFGKTLPLTPGIIPKSKDRIAGAVGNAVGENLLTQDALEKTLLSDDIKLNIETKINNKIDSMKDDERLIRDIIDYYVDGNPYDETLEKAEEVVAEKICGKVIEMDIGTLVADEAVEAIKENTLGSLVARFISDDMLYSLVKPISEKVDDMVKTRGTDIVKEKIHSEFENFQEKTVGDLFTALINSGVNAGSLIVTGYEVLIKKKLGSMLRNINITQIVQDKIDSMNALEVEKLCLQVMKKELSAIVNLGALIGFVLGCVNILFNI